MRKLTPDEEHALAVLKKHGSYVHDWNVDIDPQIIDTLNRLHRKKRVRVEETDIGPRYTLTAQGEADAL